MVNYTRTGRFLTGASRAIGKVRHGFARGQQISRGISSVAAGLQDLRGYANLNDSSVLEDVADAAGKISDISGDLSDGLRSAGPALEDFADTYTRQHGHGAGYCNRMVGNNLCRDQADHVHVNTDHGMTSRYASA